MTSTQTKRRLPALALLGTLVALGGGALLPGGGAGPLAALLGSGPVSFGAMLTCGFCLGVGISLIASGEFWVFLDSSAAWKGLGVCAAACLAVVGS